MDINEIRRLLDSFEKLDKPIIETTYLEICRYSGRRFEEICSRILSFYLSPVNEHKLGDLVLRSLIDTLEVIVRRDTPKIELGSLRYVTSNVRVKIEEYAEWKRIDLVVEGDNFIIALENKITAELYNPLDIYREHIDRSERENKIGIVLSMKPIQKDIEKDFLKKNGFYNMLYSEFFKSIEKNMEQYKSEESRQYIVFLDDFIKTIKNMDGTNIMSNELSDFFYDKSDEINELINLFRNYDNWTKRELLRYLELLRDKLTDETKSNWEIWEGTNLYCKIKDHEIGIDSRFTKYNRKPIGRVDLYLKCWSKEHWDHYKEKVLEHYPNKEIKLLDGGGAEILYATLTNETIPNFELSEIGEHFKSLYYDLARIL